MLFAGFDCGGSSTRLLVVDEHNHVHYTGQSGAANLVSTPEGRLRNSLTMASRGCEEVAYVCGCFAGLIDQHERTRAVSILADIFTGAKIRAEPDYAAAILAFEPDVDVCVIAGTGSVVCSRTETGFRKSGGGGYLLGDEGSGFQMGRDLMAQFARYPETVSADAVAAIDKVLGSSDPVRAVAALYRGGTPAPRLARLGKVLAQEAAKGEPFAIDCIRRNFGSLAGVVHEHVKKYLPERKMIRIGLAGGLWQGTALLRNKFRDILNQQLAPLDIEIDLPSRPPVQGAVQLAMELRNGN